MRDEHDFLDRLRRGDHDAFDEFVRHFEDPMYRYFLASHGDRQLACEQSADCFGNLVESLPKMRGGPDQLLPFVYAVARNVLRRHWRQQRYDCVPLAAADAAIDDRPTPDAAFEADEQSARLIEAIRSLDPPTRDVFILRFVEQHSVAEVAQTVDEPIGTVKSRLHRGRQRLAQLLRPQSEMP